MNYKLCGFKMFCKDNKKIIPLRHVFLHEEDERRTEHGAKKWNQKTDSDAHILQRKFIYSI